MVAVPADEHVAGIVFTIGVTDGPVAVTKVMRITPAPPAPPFELLPPPPPPP